MAQIFLVSFILLADAFVVLAMANNGFQSLVSSDPPAPSPSYSYWNSQESPLPRKLGNHQSVAPSPSPSIAPQSGKNEEGVSVKGQEIHLLHERHHHSFDTSVAGGGVILGGLATTFLVAVLCYIRATGRHNSDLTAA
ncbi:hypothetical protein P3X46_004931 [Hevea brasiliensis]|uniref:Uncharacterized protein n=1 Tax=Hevea brasiliensis TaxID=3981 RepID=A0ABQ9N0I4_HEVBR|nr:uncharacterized protein LOC131178537 [Hevea brasiliensis]KAJ9185278.1 hypothetical protein P3X46_004931 [Hevea brasiliensis]